MISSSLKKYDFWIARYPASDDGWMKESLRPDFGVGWQYSSKARIPGISGYVDRDVFYKDYADENTPRNKKEDEDSGEKDGAENLWERTRRLMAEQKDQLENSRGLRQGLDIQNHRRGVRKLYKIRPGCSRYQIPQDIKYSYACSAGICTGSGEMIQVLTDENSVSRFSWIWNGTIRESWEPPALRKSPKRLKKSSPRPDTVLESTAMWTGIRP